MASADWQTKQREDEDLELARRYVEIGHFPTGAAWRGAPPKVKRLLQQRAKLVLRDGVLCRRIIDITPTRYSSRLFALLNNVKKSGRGIMMLLGIWEWRGLLTAYAPISFGLAWTHKSASTMPLVRVVRCRR